MGKYVSTSKVSQPIDVVSAAMEDYLYHNHFQRTDWNGEMVFSTGNKTSPERFLRWSYACGIFTIEAWIKGPGSSEVGLDSILAGVAGSEFKASLKILERNVKEHCGHVEMGLIDEDPFVHDENHVDVPEDAKYQNSVGYDYSHGPKVEDKDVAKAYGLAILGLMLSGIPLVGLILGVLAMQAAQKVTNKAVVGVAKFLSVIAIIASFSEVLLYILWNALSNV